MSSTKMLAELKPGNRIKFPATELGLTSTELIEADVVRVNKLPEGWHQAFTSRGTLKPRQPTDKFELVEQFIGS